jgi:predicted membrane protein (TIGR00267 family)
VDGISPALSAAILVTPYLIVPRISMDSAFFASLILGLVVLFALGIFLARISDERPAVSGLQMIVVGIVTIIIVGLLARY